MLLSCLFVLLVTIITLTDAHTGNSWTSVSESKDGSILVISTIKKGILFSTDYGTSWFRSKYAPLLPWNSISMSGDGKIIVASAGKYGIYWSLDSGNDWKKVEGSFFNFQSTWKDIKISSDGQIILVCSEEGTVLRSDDYGKSWKIALHLPNGLWNSIAMSDNGQYVMISSINKELGIYVSDDYGFSWKSTGSEIARSVVASSLDNSSNEDGDSSTKQKPKQPADDDNVGNVEEVDDDGQLKQRNIVGSSLGDHSKQDSDSFTKHKPAPPADDDNDDDAQLKQRNIVGSSLGDHSKQDSDSSTKQKPAPPADDDKAGEVEEVDDDAQLKQRNIVGSSLGDHSKQDSVSSTKHKPAPPADDDNDDDDAQLKQRRLTAVYQQQQQQQHQSELSKKPYFDIVCDATGKYWIACSEGGIIRSEDFGKTWQRADSIPLSSQIMIWKKLTIDSTGQYVAAMVYGDDSSIYLSADYGKTWKTKEIDPLVFSVSSFVETSESLISLRSHPYLASLLSSFTSPFLFTSAVTAPAQEQPQQQQQEQPVKLRYSLIHYSNNGILYAFNDEFLSDSDSSSNNEVIDVNNMEESIYASYDYGETWKMLIKGEATEITSAVETRRRHRRLQLLPITGGGGGDSGNGGGNAGGNSAGILGPEPSLSPSKSPSISPSKSPSASPVASLVPTRAPTASPTTSFTISPTVQFLPNTVMTVYFDINHIAATTLTRSIQVTIGKAIANITEPIPSSVFVNDWQLNEGRRKIRRRQLDSSIPLVFDTGK
jgi:photosystem II stability/assembly factor-like uncharacterized protein